MSSILNIYTNGVTSGFETISRPPVTAVNDLVTWQNTTGSALGVTNVNINDQNIGEAKSVSFVAQAANPGGGSTVWVNSADGHLMFAGNDISAGDVAGPSSATDNAIARFDGASGKLIQNSAASVDDLGNVAARSVALEARPSNPGGSSTLWRSSLNGHLYHGNADLELAPGGGDVIGPGASTDGALVRWDGTTGTAAADSPVVLDDNGSLSAVKSVSLLSSPANPGGVATIWLNSANNHLMCGAVDLSAEVAPGTGDVVGPASTVDNAVPRFDGTTGKLVQDSQVSISDDGNMAGVNSAQFVPTVANPGNSCCLWVNAVGGHLMRGSNDVEAPHFDDSSFWITDAADATKKIKFDAGGTTATSTTLTAAQTANRVLTLPDATDTLVGKATTDVLTNKTLTEPNIAFIANGGGFLTVPSGVSDVLIGRNTVDSMTNKTLTAATNNVAARSLQTTGSNVGVAAAAPPTVGQVLTATGATTATWQTPSGGSANWARYYYTSGTGTAVSVGSGGGLNRWDTAGTFTSSGSFDQPLAGRLRYTGAAAASVMATITINFLAPTTNNTNDCSWVIKKNGSDHALAYFRSSSATAWMINTPINFIDNVATNDYYELWSYSAIAAQSITVRNVSFNVVVV